MSMAKRAVSSQGMAWRRPPRRSPRAIACHSALVLVALHICHMDANWPLHGDTFDGSVRRGPRRSSLTSFGSTAAVDLKKHGFIPRALAESLWHRWAQKAFLAIDKDHDGSLAKMEVYAAVLLFIAKINDTPLSVTPPSLEFISVAFDVADQSGNGSIDFEEFDTVLGSLMISVGVSLAIRTGTKLIVAPCLALFLMKKAREHLPPGTLHTFFDQRFGSVLCTIFLCGIIVPSTMDLLEPHMHRQMMRRVLANS
eukprot:CAMPEP_0179015944 /NCGR_PEP_ID=MMETSP0796-20121207/3060_1 /TAXON_ID=73915 /ORGANISM="Pyrodinium bahamense, Strain pbaha01" /LENGTH=253 /DNA_ID=CAMNT_0020711609 /DNA_START=18 /DNA_END=775 /DNA_ORIENTATION=-